LEGETGKLVSGPDTFQAGAKRVIVCGYKPMIKYTGRLSGRLKLVIIGKIGF